MANRNGESNTPRAIEVCPDCGGNLNEPAENCYAPSSWRSHGGAPPKGTPPAREMSGRELAALLNRYSIDNALGVPDHELARRVFEYPRLRAALAKAQELVLAWEPHAPVGDDTLTTAERTLDELGEVLGLWGRNSP